MARKSNTAPATSVAALMGAWLSGLDKTEVAIAAIAEAICKEYQITTPEELRFFAAPKTADEKADNRHAVTFGGIYAAVEENITVKGKRILPATVAALRDKNIEGKTLLQGIPKSVSDATNWKGQIKVRIKTLRDAVARHIAAGAEKTTTTRTEKGDAEYMRERMQAMFNRANKSETFALADVATFNAWMENGAKMLGIKITKVK